MFASQDQSIDQKLMTLWSNYADNNQVATSLRDVESMRQSSQNLGIMVSIAAFGLNEVARLTLRSPIFKLKVQNVAFFAMAPTLFARYSYQQTINDRIDVLWRIHENREKQGLGATKNAQNMTDESEHTGDRAFQINNGIHFSFDSILTGARESPMLNNPFTRFHKTIEKYPHEHDNMDDEKLYTTDNFERMKPLMPKKGSTVGTTTLIPTVDTDEKLFFYDTQGESLYTNPPDPNVPHVDHGLDEASPWAFRKTNYNQVVVTNQYARDIWGALKEKNAPWWGIKLASPAFFKNDKYAKFFEQYSIRLDFEALKLRHAKELRTGDMAQRDQMKGEIQQFLADAQKRMLESELKDVYVTDHKAKALKMTTLSEEEDAEYYEYIRKLNEYNRQPMQGDRVSQFQSGRYELGSLKQRIFEPLAGAKTLENGTVFYEITEQEISGRIAEDELRNAYNKQKSLGVVEGEDENEVRAGMFDQIQQAGFDIEEWDKILAREFDTFKEGEKYDYVTDLRRTFDASVSESTASKIFKKIPQHVFYDIKKPQQGTHKEYYLNPYNTARKYPFESFFDMRSHEDWIQSKEEMRNTTTNISRHTRI